MASILLSLSAASGGETVLRDSEQAALVDGALQLKNGQSKRGASFPDYHKQYLSYWLSVPPGPLPSADSPAATADAIAERAVTWANLACGSVALIGFWAMWFSCLKKASAGRVLSATAFTLSPVVMLSIVSANAAVFSAGFLLALIAVLSGRGRWIKRLRPPFVALLAFAAVAANAWAALCLPLLAWASFRGRSWRRFRSHPQVLLMLAAAVTALLLGWWLAGDTSHSNLSRALRDSTGAAFTLIFALGGCVILMVVQGIAIGCNVKCRFQMMGAFLLVLPLAYFPGWTAFAPRDYLTAAIAILGAGVLWKGRTLYRFWSRRKPRLVRGFAIAVLVPSVCLLVVGIYHPPGSKPRPVFTQATAFPTDHGYWPMGATLSFLGRWSQADQTPIDHHQTVWRAALAGDYSACPSDLHVPIIRSEMSAILRLAVRCQGRESAGVSALAVANGEVPCAFVDFRALSMVSGRAAHTPIEEPSVAALLDRGLGMHIVSPPGAEQWVIRVDQSGEIDRAVSERLAVTALSTGDSFFGGVDFLPSGVVVAAIGESAWRPGKRDGGKSLIFSSRAEFSIAGRQTKVHSDGEWWLLRLTGAELTAGGNITLDRRADPAATIHRWLGSLPD